MRKNPIATPTSMEPRPLGEWSNVRTVARYYDCSESTVRDWILRGLLPSSKVGRRRVIARADVLAFIKRPVAL